MNDSRWKVIVGWCGGERDAAKVLAALDACDREAGIVRVDTRDEAAEAIVLDVLEDDGNEGKTLLELAQTILAALGGFTENPGDAS